MLFIFNEEEPRRLLVVTVPGERPEDSAPRVAPFPTGSNGFSPPINPFTEELRLDPVQVRGPTPVDDADSFEFAPGFTAGRIIEFDGVYQFELYSNSDTCGYFDLGREGPSPEDRVVDGADVIIVTGRFHDITEFLASWTPTSCGSIDI